MKLRRGRYRFSATAVGAVTMSIALSIAFRFISLILIVVALMLLGADIVTSLEKSEITVRTIGQVWAMAGKDSLEAFKSWVETTLPSPVPGWIYGLLGMWAWGVVGVFGIVLAFLFGRRHMEA